VVTFISRSAVVGVLDVVFEVKGEQRFSRAHLSDAMWGFMSLARAQRRLRDIGGVDLNRLKEKRMV
jgi:hypothetical protein